MTADDKKLSVEDRLDIQELFAKYSWAIDLADAEVLLVEDVEVRPVALEALGLPE